MPSGARGTRIEERESVEIAAPPEKIWPLLVEPENTLKWYAGASPALTPALPRDAAASVQVQICP